MQTFSLRRTVTEEDIDELNHMNNVRYVQWIQDIAKAHWEKNTTAAMRSSYFWVVRNHNIDYKAEAKLGDELLVTTFVSTSEGFTSTREVRMTNLRTDTVVLESKTRWILIDAQTLKPTKLTSEIIALFV